MDLEQLLQLSLIEIKDKKEREKMLSDLEKILNYFSNLKEVDTENINPNYTGHSEESINQFKTEEERISSDFTAKNNLKKGEYLRGPKIL